jgi:hypothetical protein
MEGFDENVAFVASELAKPAVDDAVRLKDEILAMVPYGAMLYRLQQYEKAVDTLGDSLANVSEATDYNTEYWRICAGYFLAMARHQLGHEVQARRLLHQARAADDLLQTNPLLRWHERVALDTLHREAQELIEP